MKRISIAACAVSLGMALCVCAGTVAALAGSVTSAWADDDTDSTTYIIDDEDEFSTLATAVNGGQSCEGLTFKLGGDIVLSKTWTPIGTTDAPFSGTFDGNGYTISNLKYSSSSQDYVGLFGYINTAVIENVTIENVILTGAEGVGAVVGWADLASESLEHYSVIKGCTVKGSIQISGTYGVGGILGCGEKTVIEDCVVEATEDSGSVIYARNALVLGEDVGGIAGFIGVTQNTDLISHIYNVSVSNLDIYGGYKVGGILGYTDVMGTTGNPFKISTTGSYINTVTNCNIYIKTGLLMGLYKTYIGAVLGATYYSMTIENCAIDEVDLGWYDLDCVYAGWENDLGELENVGYYGGINKNTDENATITLTNCTGSADLYKV
ncbi:MAG: hypothetical protein LUE27_02095 [Clostridia bacterium]|nr:hypothetical protein [Clostridia bacterium]